MIYETLQILQEQLENYFVEVGLGKIIALENIALWESGSDDAKKLDGKVVLTLLKMEEEPTLKNIPAYKIKNGKTHHRFHNRREAEIAKGKFSPIFSSDREEAG